MPAQHSFTLAEYLGWTGTYARALQALLVATGDEGTEGTAAHPRLPLERQGGILHTTCTRRSRSRAWSPRLRSLRPGHTPPRWAPAPCGALSTPRLLHRFPSDPPSCRKPTVLEPTSPLSRHLPPDPGPSRP